MATPALPEETQRRYKETIEAALRDGFDPWRQNLGGKGSSVQEAVRRLIAAGFGADEKSVNNSINGWLRVQGRRQARGLDFILPDWAMFAKAGVAPAEMRRGQVYRWILTAAQDDTDVHPRFWANLQAYATYVDAALVVAGFTYQQMRHTDRMTLTQTYRPEVRDFLRFDPMDCGPVLFAAEMNTLPTAVRPLSGLLTYSRGRDVIFPHAKLAYQTVPQMPGAYVPSAMTTGACTVPNYIPKKAGLKAQFHHVLGATIVEVDDSGNAWCRQINAAADGSFQDLDAVVRDGRVSRGHRVKAITWGDIHLPSVETHVHEALWGQNGNAMVEALRPEYQFFHDLLSFEAHSRHVEHDPLHWAAMVYGGQSSVEDQVRIGARFLRDTQRDWCRSVVVESNHDDRLMQWTRKDCDRRDVENVLFWHRCNIAALEAKRDGIEEFNLFRWALKASDPHELPGIDFVPMGGSFQICQDQGGIECGLHGHQGPNGSRGTPTGLASMATRITIGDKHSPEITDGVYVAGMTGALDQGYNTGPSSWRRAHIVAYANSKRAIVTQAEDGRWRA